MSTAAFDPAQHPRGLAGRFTEKPAADPGDILTGRTLEPWQLDGARDAYEAAACELADMVGVGDYDITDDGVPVMFDLVDGDPLRLRVNTRTDADALARAARDCINASFGPGGHVEYDGPVVTATVDWFDLAVVNLAVERRPGPDECIECGDRRGWRVEPDPATGDAMQVQCRTCAERTTDHIPGTRFIPADEPMGQHWHVASCSCSWEGSRFDSQKAAKRAADVHAQLASARS